MENDQGPALNKRQYFQMALAGAIVAATLIAYIPAMRGGYIWDDDAYVARNGALRSLAGLWAIWTDREATPQYYPLVHTGFWLEYHLWGLDPLGYHVVNVLLHALGAVILWRVLLHLGVPGAYFIAAIFALHPVQVESVAWVTERKNVLSGVFYLSALWAYLRFNPLNSTQEPHRERWGYYALTVAFFVCALLSKSVTATLPAVVVLLLWWKRDRFPWRDLLPLAPLFVIGVLAGLSTAVLEKESVGASGPEWQLSLADRVLVAGRALWFYAGKLTSPTELIFIYPRWQVDSSSAVQWFFPAAVVAVIVGLWLRRKRIGKGPLVAVLFFAGTLFPALGFLNVYPMRFSFVADHFQYLASIGVIALVIAFFAMLARNWGLSAVVAALAGVALVGVLAALTWRQGQMYKDAETLWRHTLAKNSRAWIAHQNLGMLLRERGDLEGALACVATAKSIYPTDAGLRNSMGVTLAAIAANVPDPAARDQVYRLAVEEFRQALTYDPNMERVHYNLANSLHQLGQLDEAVGEYQAAIRLSRHGRGSPEAWTNLGAVLVDKGDPKAGQESFEKALAVDPEYPLAHFDLAHIQADAGQIDIAIAHLRQVLKIAPNYPRAARTLATLLAAKGQLEEAAKLYARAVRTDSRDNLSRGLLGLILKARGKAEAINALAWTLATSANAAFRDGARAIDLAQKACELTDWRSAGAMDTLAAAYAETGKFDQAVETARKALELAKSRQNPALLNDIQQHLDCFMARRPYREQPTTAPAEK